MDKATYTYEEGKKDLLGWFNLEVLRENHNNNNCWVLLPTTTAIPLKPHQFILNGNKRHD